MNAHLGRSLSAFVDGELDHGAREQIQVHLAHCASCRADLAGLRLLKGALQVHLPQSAPPDLAARVLARTAEPGHVAPIAVRRSARRPTAGPVRRWVGVIGAFTVGAGGALLVAGPPPAAPSVPIDPTSAGLILEHVSTANEVPFAGPGAVTVTGPVLLPAGFSVPER